MEMWGKRRWKRRRRDRMERRREKRGKRRLKKRGRVCERVNKNRKARQATSAC